MAAALIGQPVNVSQPLGQELDGTRRRLAISGPEHSVEFCQRGVANVWKSGAKMYTGCRRQRRQGTGVN